MSAYYDGDKVRITADHILLKGRQGTITRWVHDSVYIVKMENGRDIVLKGNEMVNLSGREQ